MTQHTEFAPATENTATLAQPETAAPAAAPANLAKPADTATAANPAQQASAASARPANRVTVAPAVDIFEDSTGITLLADLPGVSKDRLDIKVESNHIWIEGEAALRVPEGFKLLHTEARVPVYRRSFALGPELDKSRIEANLKDGVLTLRIPRLAQAQPRRIEVRTA